MKRLVFLVLLPFMLQAGDLQLQLSVEGSQDDATWTNVFTYPCMVSATNTQGYFWSPPPIVIPEGDTSAGFRVQLLEGTNLLTVTNQLFEGTFSETVPSGGYAFYRTHLEIIPVP